MQKLSLNYNCPEMEWATLSLNDRMLRTCKGNSTMAKELEQINSSKIVYGPVILKVPSRLVYNAGSQAPFQSS